MYYLRQNKQSRFSYLKRRFEKGHKAEAWAGKRDEFLETGETGSKALLFKDSVLAVILLRTHINIGTDKCWLPNTAIMMKVSSSKQAACSSLNHNTDINMRSWLFHLLPRGSSEMLVFSGLDHLSPSSVQCVLQRCENSWPHSWLRLCKRHKRAKSLLKKVLGWVLLTSINHYHYNLRHNRKNEGYKVLHNQEMKVWQ